MKSYRQIEVEQQDDIRDIFLDLKDEGYDILYDWDPAFSGDLMTAGNYPCILVSKEGLKESVYIGDNFNINNFNFSIDVLEEYINRLKDLLGDEWDINIECVQNSIMYWILLVRK
jgi:hypothetical protein